MKTGLVLSGGSIKGAFQAGAICEILDSGVEPDGIYGISVGSLNGGLLTDRSGYARRSGEKLDWKEISNDLEKLWLEKIVSFDKIGKKRRWYQLLWRLIWSKFDGLLDMKKLYKLVHETLNEDNLRESPVRFKAGSVNVADGTLFQADNHTPNLIKYIIASTAIPVVMPVARVAGQPLVDGGIRDVAALKPAIKDGMDEVICVLCQPRDLSGAQINVGDLRQFTERIMDIVINETVNNDIEWAEFINEHAPDDGRPVESGPLQGYRRVPVTVIRPSGPLDIDLESFNRNDIRRIFEEGRGAAQNEMKKRARRIGEVKTP